MEINGHAASTAERRVLFTEDCHIVVGRFARELQPPFPCDGGSVYSKRLMARFCRCRNSPAPAFASAWSRAQNFERLCGHDGMDPPSSPAARGRFNASTVIAKEFA